MIMDIDTLAAIQREHHRELMHQVEQERLLQKQNNNGNHAGMKVKGRQPAGGAWATLQQKLFGLFQMRIRTVFPH